jgi:hypothetical protein
MSTENQNPNNNSVMSKIGKCLLWGGVATSVVGIVPIILGFGTIGVAGGSIAALIQSSIGLVKAGSVFSMMQSAGMCGYFVTTAAVGGGAAVGGVATLIGDSSSSKISFLNRYKII